MTASSIGLVNSKPPMLKNGLKMNEWRPGAGNAAAVLDVASASASSVWALTRDSFVVTHK